MFKLGDKIRGDLSEFSGIAAIVPAQKLVKITFDQDLPEGFCRGLWAAEDGTANLTFKDGHTEDGVPLFAGLNQIAVAQVRSGGTLTDLWAIY